MFCVNKFIESSKKKVEAYLDKLVDVKDPDEVRACVFPFLIAPS